MSRPENKEELFNLRHSSLRNAIERIFGILKRRFKIIRTAPEYRFENQVLLVLALCGLHNYIGEHVVAGEEVLGLDAESEVEEDTGNYYDTTSETSSATAMDTKREEIAKQMWNDYELYRTRQ